MRQMLTISLLLLACCAWGQPVPKDPHRDSLVANAITNKPEMCMGGSIDSVKVLLTLPMSDYEVFDAMKQCKWVDIDTKESLAAQIPAPDSMVKKDYYTFVSYRLTTYKGVSEYKADVFLDNHFKIACYNTFLMY